MRLLPRLARMTQVYGAPQGMTPKLRRFIDVGGLAIDQHFTKPGMVQSLSFLPIPGRLSPRLRVPARI